ncbi:MAG: nuclear transport factor 2 family protein [Terriglobia bacterium]
MRRVIPLLLIAVIASASALQAQSRDERAVRALLDRLFQAGNSVDIGVVRQTLGEYGRGAGPFYPPFEARLASVAEVEALLGQYLGQVSARSYQPTSPVKVQVDRRSAWATYTWRMDLTFKDGTRRSLAGRTTLTFVKEGRNWRVAHWHSSLPTPLPPTASALQAEEQAILQVVRNGWEAVRTKQMEQIAAFFANAASIFYDDQAYRVQGKQAIVRDFEAWLAQTSLHSYQILDPQVQVLGDTAILTYYFTDSGVTAGKEFTHAGKISVVFTKQDGTWRALHQHISLNR